MLWPDDIEGPEKIDVVADSYIDAVKQAVKAPMIRMVAQMMERQWSMQIIAPGTAIDRMYCIAIKHRVVEV